MEPRLRKGLTLLAVPLLLLGAVHAHAGDLIRIGTNLWPGYAPLHLAADRREWNERSQIRLVDYPSTTEVLRALRNGLIEGAAVTLDELLTIADDTTPVTAILVFDISMGGDAIIARPEYPSLAALRGKRIGVESGALGAYVITRALELNALALQDVEIIPVELGGHRAAFREGMVDAVVTFEPVRSDLLTDGGREVFSSRDIPGEIVDVLVIRTDVLESQAKAVHEIVDGWFDALSYIAANPDGACAQIARRVGTSPERACASYAGLELPNRDRNRALLGGELTPTLVRLHEIATRNGLVGGRPLPSGLLSDRFLRDCRRCAR